MIYATAKRGLLFALAGLTCLGASPALAQKGLNKDELTYRFQSGDTLIGLAKSYFINPNDYKIVRRRNNIRDPRKIPVGKRLKIPFTILKFQSSKANLISFRGDVDISKAGRKTLAKKGTTLTEGSRLSTSARSFLTLGLEDGSRVSMPSNSRLKIARLRRILLTGSIDYEFVVENGSIRSKITPFSNTSDRHRVRTPTAVSAVRGTEFRTRVDDQSGTAFSETLEGAVAVAAKGSNVTTAVEAGNGAAVDRSGSVAKAKLLPPPDILNGTALQSEENLTFNAKPTDAAAGYRVLVSSDAGFVDVVGETRSLDDAVTLEGIPNGRYFLQASAISKDDFEGLPATYSFKRVLSTVSGEVEPGEFGYRFKWFGAGEGNIKYHFQIVSGSKSGTAFVDEAGLTQPSFLISDIPAGQYFWRIGKTQFVDGDIVQKWTDFEKLDVESTDR